jgi:hypothetical protein
MRVRPQRLRRCGRANAEPPPRPAASSACALSVGGGADDRKTRARGVDGITRFEAASKVCGHWIRLVGLGCASSTEAWTAVSDWNSACLIPPLNERRLHRIFERLHRRHEAAQGSRANNAKRREHGTATERRCARGHLRSGLGRRPAPRRRLGSLDVLERRALGAR